jgi:hypothetical protein
MDAAAEALEYSRQKIWRIENGLNAVRVLDVKAMCELYGVPPKMSGALCGLAAETKSKGWWHAYGDSIPSWFELYLGLEAAASHLREYEETLVPGLLQTKEYALSIHQLDSPNASEEDHDRLVTVRMQRQSLLTRRAPEPPRLETVLSEAALRRPVGGPDVMADQLRHLRKVAELPNVSLRVLPLAAGLFPGARAGSFVILDFPPGSKVRVIPEPSVVYSEALTGAIYLDRPEELAAYEHTWHGLTALALGEKQSIDMLTTLINEVHHD